MKRTTAFWRTCVLLTSASITASTLSACSGGGSASVGAASGGTGKKDVKVALVLGLTDDPFMQEVAQGSQDAGKDLGATVTVTGPPAPNPTVGVSQLRQVVSRGLDGVTVMPLPATLWTKGITDAAATTPVNIVNTLAVKGTRGGDTYIGINDAAASQSMMAYLQSKLPAGASGSIVLGSCIPGVSALDSRTKAYQDYIHQHLPNVTVVGPVATTTDATGNLSNWQHAYAAHPDALAYIGNCDSDGPSLVRLHQQHPGNYLTGTFDVDPTSLTGIRSGALTVAVDESPYARGYLATAALVRAAQGKPRIKGFVNIHGELITQDDVAKVIAREASPASTRAGFTSEITTFLDSQPTSGGPVTLEPIANAYAGAVAA